MHTLHNAPDPYVVGILPALEQLSEDVQALVARSSLLWVPAKYEGLAPSLFRHLTYWPDLLLLFTNRLDAFESDATRRIAPLVSQALETAKFHASGLCKADNSLKELNCKDRKWLQEVLTVFIDVMLARGVIIVPALRALLSANGK